MRYPRHPTDLFHAPSLCKQNGTQMQTPTNFSRTALLAPLLLVSAGMATVAALYTLALPGYWLFDDWPNLVALNQVNDVQSALRFILSGEAGPLGRQVSLATFALQADAWDNHPEAMLKVNFGIHLLAMVAVFFLASGLSRARLANAPAKTWWIGALVATIWGLAPFLATTHLMAIQRMTSLSGLFVFAGLALFVWAHFMEQQRWRQLALATGLGLATLLATLSKENGALLPLLALVMLLAWIPRELWLRDTVDRWLLGLLMFLPSAFIIFYLGSGFIETLQRGDYGSGREFSPWERILTQPVIVLDYLHQLLLPRPIAATPFMDHTPHSSGWLEPPITLVAWILWFALAGLALLLRNRAPWLAFGLAFFLIGHVVESTYINLELYFAHRNYVPAFGVFFALVYFALTISAAHFRLATSVVGAYALIMAVNLFQVTASWNDRAVTAQLWVNHNPHSIRAAQYLASHYLSEGEYRAAGRTLEQAAQQYPHNALLQIQRTNNCVNDVEGFPDLLEQVKAALEATPRYRPIGPIELNQLARSESPSVLCPPRDHNAIIEMADALLANPKYARRDFAASQLQLAKGFALAQLGEYKRAVEHFHEGIRLQPDLEVAFRALSLQANLGDYDSAFSFLNELETYIPNDPLRRGLWRVRLDEFREILQDSQKIDEGKAINDARANNRF